ncbi:MAG: uracil-DNA glycosylase [Gammaproteobacteria bacterium]|nr:uracil-DNA glycosylase [Gammaproteobacteria bacterium]
MSSRDSSIAKPQGCTLDETTRVEYLQAMGIQPWYSRHESDDLTETHAQVAEPVVAEVSESAEVLKIEPDLLPGKIDISTCDWPTLEQQVSHCQLCELHQTRTQTVFDVGNRNADLMLIGEAPGEEEDIKGDPFVGSAGHLLDAMMQAIGLDRQNVYITNVLKCHPPANRKPHTSEIVCCDPYLQQQIKLVQPKLILALGRVAAHHLLLTQDKLGSLRQKQYTYNGIPLYVSYHPAYLLRKPIEKRKSWQDLLEVRRFLNNN